MGPPRTADSRRRHSWLHAALLVGAAVVVAVSVLASVPVCRHAVTAVVEGVVQAMPQRTG